ncbi:MAG: hypothetical protein S4CHLAM20_02530 [Chlamydiia bacterium]|nr:hypothetical protein [Chlamydiia bacterium]
MNEKCGRNDPCPCGSGKKYKKCCGKQKKLASRGASVISSGGGGSLLDRIKAGGQAAGDKSSSLKDRISKQINSNDVKKND